MSENIEQKCLAKGVKLTDQRKIIAKIMSESNDHPDVDELYNRVSKIDSKISIATVYRTVKLFEESGIVSKHDFKGNKARYEQAPQEHHDHLIDVKSGLEFEVATAKIRAGESAGLAASIGHQVHGAIGFTDEYRLHYLTRRLWSWRSEYGSESYWAQKIGKAVITGGADNLWADITARL